MPGQDLAGADSPLSGALGTLDARITALEKGGAQFSPGMIAWTTSDTAPPGWLIADGTAFDTARYAALAVIIPGGVLPDLRNRFPIGAGDTYTLLATGGANAVTLTAAQSGVPAHTHAAPTITIGSEASHTHSGTTGAGSAHHHAGSGGNFALTNFTAEVASGASFAAVNSVTAATTDESSHTHSFTTGGGSSHTHSGTSSTIPASSAANASTPVSLLNPYIALTPLIKV